MISKRSAIEADRTGRRRTERTFPPIPAPAAINHRPDIVETPDASDAAGRPPRNRAHADIFADAADSFSVFLEILLEKSVFMYNIIQIDRGSRRAPSRRFRAVQNRKTIKRSHPERLFS